MAHELNFTNGRADFFEIGDQVTAWHKEGIALPAGTGLQAALAGANMVYEVEKQPVYRLGGALTDRDHVWYECETGAVTVRKDTGRELGVVGSDYSVVQNSEAFGMLEPLMDAGSLRLECGGVLRGGADAWVLAQLNRAAFPQEVQDALKGEIAKFILVRTNHTGRSNASVTETDVRVVCANTLALVEGGAYRTQASVIHRGDATGRLQLAAQSVLTGIVQRTIDTIARYRRLQGLILNEAQWESRVMDVVQRDPRILEDFKADSMQSAAVIGRYEAKRDELHTLWFKGRGHTGDSSAWEAYNGVAEAIDHRADLFPVRSTRVQQLMPGGRLAGIKEAVFNSLLEVA